jgi:hypothetical protein
MYILLHNTKLFIRLSTLDFPHKTRFEDTNGEIRRRTLKGRQFNGKSKVDKRINNLVLCNKMYIVHGAN